MKLSVFFTGSDQIWSFLQGVLILKFGRKIPKTYHPWNTRQTRYLPELPGGRSKPTPESEEYVEETNAGFYWTAVECAI